MSYAVEYRASVEGELSKQPRNVLDRADAALQNLSETPRPHGSIKLTGVDAYRIRVGDYRIVYSIDDREQSVVIQAVRHRREVHRGM